MATPVDPDAKYRHWKLSDTVQSNQVCEEMWRCFRVHSAAEVRVVKNKRDSYSVYYR